MVCSGCVSGGKKKKKRIEAIVLSSKICYEGQLNFYWTFQQLFKTTGLWVICPGFFFCFVLVFFACSIQQNLVFFIGWYLVQFLSRISFWLGWWGGELPYFFLRQEIMKLIRKIKEKGFLCMQIAGGKRKNHPSVHVEEWPFECVSCWVVSA